MTSPKTYGLTHLAIAVNDVERTLKFYQQVFDMQTMYHKDGFIQLTTPGCKDIIVFEEKKISQLEIWEESHILASVLKNHLILMKL